MRPFTKTFAIGFAQVTGSVVQSGQFIAIRWLTGDSIFSCAVACMTALAAMFVTAIGIIPVILALLAILNQPIDPWVIRQPQGIRPSPYNAVEQVVAVVPALVTGLGPPHVINRISIEQQK
jgi:hypothetical protein